MGKIGKLRKKRRLEREIVQKKTGNEDDVEEKMVEVEEGERPCRHSHSLTDVVAATRVISAMAEQPEAFRGKEYKALRAALHSLRQSEGASMVLGFGKRDISLTQVVTDALRDGRWSDALVGLQKMRGQKQIPKLGAVCRWVRECDAAGEGGNHDAILVLDAVLRTADPPQVGAMQTEAALLSLRDAAGAALAGEARYGGHVVCFPAWDPFERGPVAAEEAGETMRRSQAQTEDQRQHWRRQFRPCLVESGAARKPPNLFDLVIHASVGSPLALGPAGRVVKLAAPFVPGAFLLEGVFSPAECAAIIQAGEAVGFDPDQPAGGTSAAGKQSVLAHAFVWCTDRPFVNDVWRRVAHFMPAQLGGGEPVGINRRWRCYRYQPGAVYRPHIDGGWPGSGLRGEDDDQAEGGEYLYDAFSDGRTSRLTFLIYLNDDFIGGATTYFLPDKDKEGVLRARGVRPKTGCVMVFPHGETEGALLHEGSAVEAGAKYVVRTDVLYRPLAYQPQ